MEKYIVLHAERGLHTTDPFSPTVAAAGMRVDNPPAPKLEMADLSPRDVVSAARVGSGLIQAPQS